MLLSLAALFGRKKLSEEIFAGFVGIYLVMFAKRRYLVGAEGAGEMNGTASVCQVSVSAPTSPIHCPPSSCLLLIKGRL